MNEQTKQPVANAKRRPHYLSLLDPNFKYVPAAATDVQKTWKRFGWVPSEKNQGTPDADSKSNSQTG